MLQDIERLKSRKPRTGKSLLRGRGTKIGKSVLFVVSKGEKLSKACNGIPGVDVQTAYSLGRNVNVSIRGSSDFKPGGYNNRVLLLLDGCILFVLHTIFSCLVLIMFQFFQLIENNLFFQLPLPL